MGGALCVRLFIQFAQFLPELHQLKEILGARKRVIAGWLRLGARLVLPSSGTFFNDNVKPSICRNRDNDILIEGQVVQLLVARNPDVGGNLISQQSALRERSSEPARSH